MPREPRLTSALDCGERQQIFLQQPTFGGRQLFELNTHLIALHHPHDAPQSGDWWLSGKKKNTDFDRGANGKRVRRSYKSAVQA